MQQETVNIIFLFISIALGLFALGSGAYIMLSGLFGLKKKIEMSLQFSTELVRMVLNDVKRSDEREVGPEKWREEIGAMEQLFSSFANMRSKRAFLGSSIPFIISLEIANPSDSEEIFFYLSFPRKYREDIEKQVHSFFPHASIESIEDYTIFRPKSFVATATLALKSTSALPVLTYQEMNTDPLNEITNAMSKLQTETEGAALQLILYPAGGSWRNEGRSIAHEMQQGKRLKDARKQSFLAKLGDGLGSVFLSAFLGKKIESQKDDKYIQLTPEEQDLVKAIEQKTRKPAFYTNIRILSSGDTQERATQILSQMENAFSQFERSDINFFRIKERSETKKIGFQYIMRFFNRRGAMLLGVEEIASIYHFPISSTKTPKIKWLKAGSAPPPTLIPREGILLGHNDYRNVITDVRLSQADRRRHLYVIGQTGVGKSVFLTELIKQDVREGRGVCYIDPHGDAIEEILSAVPKERIEDVIHFDPADTGRPFGLNMLEYDKPEQKTFVINEMINIFDKLYDLRQTGGPMFEQYMRNAMLLIMEDTESGSTLLEIPRVLSDEQFRRMKLSKCNNPIVKNFWIKEAEKAGGDAALANVVPYITSKLTQFISNDMMRPIISQQRSTIDFRKCMDEEKILLINLSKGRIGEINSYLLGMIIVGKILMASLSRVDISENERKDFYLYIDEFQNVTTDSISQILSEARKYRLSLTIAHQFIGQLSEGISKAVFGNVGSMAAFRVGPEDAEFLEKQFAPIFSASDLLNVDNYSCFVRLLLNNESTKPFNIKTYPSTQGNIDQVSLIKQYSRLRYGRDAKIIEEEIRNRIVM
ncbi:MAG: type IV secretion system DNA-binding domain-containing protein [Candidatus Moraniibacteriota bacterium]|nr:MAG: type IV secretion system DNA-binding domain-containing protein [Candidatus Moranbacteria bacterium]